MNTMSKTGVTSMRTKGVSPSLQQLPRSFGPALKAYQAGAITDSKGVPIEVGDIVILAQQAGRNGDVTYREMLVTGTTEKMIRAVTHESNRRNMLESLTRYAGSFKGTPRQHGAVIAPWNTYLLTKNYMSPDDIKNAMSDKAAEDIVTAHFQQGDFL